MVIALMIKKLTPIIGVQFVIQKQMDLLIELSKVSFFIRI